jgi:hypothetical protein
MHLDAPRPPGTNSLPSSNEQLVQTLLLQITMQLQALATLSPSSLKQVQLQILAATVSAAAIPAPAVPPPHRQQAPMSWSGADAAAILAQVHLAATAHQIQPVVPTGALPAVNAVALQHLLPVMQSPPTGGPLLNHYGMNHLGITGNVPLTGSNPILAPPISQAQVIQSDQASHGREREGNSVVRSNAAHQFGSTVPNNEPRPQRQSAKAGNSMADFLDKLKQRHSEALEQEARRERAERGGSGNCKRTTACTAGGEETNSTNSSSSESLVRRASSVAVGAVAKKVKQEDGRVGGDGGIVALLPFEHATTVSSGSGCTTVDGSTSSSTENPQASDETRNDGSASSNTTSSYSEEDEDDIEPGQESLKHRSSVPLRKRFRSENNGGITRRNLEDHNFRMAAENMKNQDI